MKLMFVLLTVVQTIVCAQSPAENLDGFNAKESYVNSFFAAVGVSFQAETTNTPPWRLPESVSFQGTNWTVQTQAIADIESQLVYSVLSPDGLTNIIVRTDNLPTCTGVRFSLASAINLPCNLPASMIASAFSVEQKGNGIDFLFGPRPAFSGSHVFVVCRNLILSFPAANIEFGKELGLSLLRAGGVEIPDEPEPQDPNLDPEL